MTREQEIKEYFAAYGVEQAYTEIDIAHYITQGDDPPYKLGRILISVDPTMDPEDVMALYAAERNKMLPHRVRRCEERTKAVCAFVTRKRAKQRIAWKKLVDQWDTSCPDGWGFDGNVQAFRTYWHRGFRGLFPELNDD